MRKLSTTLLLLIIFQFASAQKKSDIKAQLTETSVVKDTLGTEYPHVIWSRLLVTGRYDVKPEKPEIETSPFIISRLSDEQYEQRMASMPKPNESTFFKTGSKFSHFKTTDMAGNKINTKDLSGKIIVLNFWFINCPPCRLEMPDLHELAETYKADTNIAFIAVALDKKPELQEFLKTHAFGYQMIDDGHYIVRQYNLNSFPTNVIINPEGKVYFHSTGLSANTVYWLKKSIRELKKNMDKNQEIASQ